jgi:2,3-bisphosphoglycerate-independent phosphoglycerate mutase
MRREDGRALHLIGLVSDGGVHSQQRHLYALLRMAAQHKLERVFVHAFMDGRDTLPTSGLGYLEELQQKFAEYGVGKLASVSGRYFAMDRDLRWEKERKAFRCDGDRAGAGREVCRCVARVRRVTTTDYG